MQREKEQIQTLLLREAESRANIIESEVKRKTEELNIALESQKILLSEVHHRVKNNLQIILSIIEMQGEKFKAEPVGRAFVDLENRINAMAKSYEMLIVDEHLGSIDMREYITQLLEDIEISLFSNEEDLNIELDIRAKLPLREAIYIGLIINELVTNSYKHLDNKRDKSISLNFKQNRNLYQLTVADSGRGFSPQKVKKSLGLTLIYALVQEQLKGSISFSGNPTTQYTIHFRLD
jgi:two-component sensor histidine kinase